MTKAELIEILKPFPDDLPIVIPGEAHGDGVNDLTVVSEVNIYRDVNEFYFGRHDLVFDDPQAEKAILLGSEEE